MAEGPGGKEVGRISIRVAPNTTGFRKKLKTALEQIEQTVSVAVPVDLDASGVRAHMAELMTRLRAQAGRGVQIETRLDNNTLQNGARNLARSMTNLGDAASDARTSMAGLGSTGLLVGAVLAAAAPAVGLVSGLLAGLPSLAASFGAGAGAIALGLDGIKASAAGLAPQLEALKASVSAVFEQRLTPIFQQLQGVFPVLQAGMQSVAGGLSDMLQGAASAISSPQGLGQLQSILGNTASMFSGLQPVVQSFTQSFLTLSDAGARSFGLLTGSLSKFSTDFGAMVDRITSNGAFEGAMQGLSQTLDSVLSVFNRLMESGVQAMGQLGGPLSTLLNGLGDALVAMMPALTAFSSLIGNVLGQALSALAPVITAITPAFTQLATTLSTALSGSLQAMAPVLGQIATALGGALLTAIQAIQPALPGLLQAFQQFATVLSGQLSQHLPQLADSFGRLLSAIAPLAPLLATGLVQAMTALVPVVAQLTPVITQFMNSLSQGIGVLTSVVQWFNKIRDSAGEFAQAVTTAVGQVMTEITALPGKIAAVAGSFGSALVGAGKALMDGLLSGIRNGFEAVKSFVSTIAGTIASLKGPLPYDRTVLVANGVALMDGLGAGLDKGMDAVRDQVSGFAAEISDTMSPADVADEWAKSFPQKLGSIGGDFAKATGQQFLQDLGFSGSGAIPELINYGLDFGSQFVFNVRNVDEAMAVKNNQTNKQALQYNRR